LRTFVVVLPSGARYWTVLDEELQVVGVADAFLRHVRFGRGRAESTTRSYAMSIALFLRWCARGGRSWVAGAGQLALFMVWLQYAGPGVSGLEAGTGGAVVLGGPGTAPVRGPRRVNNVLTAVREMVVHAVANGAAPGSLLPVLFEVADDRELPAAARGDEARMGWRMRARHRLAEPDRAKGRASDEQIAALVSGCLSARDRLIVVLLARAGLRRGEACGLRRSDCHLMVDSAALGCDVKRAHLHVVRRDNGNGAWAKSPHERVVPLDHVSVAAFDAYEFERMAVPAAAASDFVLVNLRRGRVGGPMRVDAVNEVLTAASGRAGLDEAVVPHSLRHAFGSSLADAEVGMDVIQDLMGHRSITSTRLYVHPDEARLRAAVELVASPREHSGIDR